MRASDKVVKMVRKLLRLSNSPNPHEAERAREEAERLMRRHGLTYADVEEDTVIPVKVADDRVDANLARVVGISRRCQAAINRHGQLAYRGKQQAAERAGALYIYLTDAVSAHCEIGPYDPGRHVHRRYFWGGFIAAITERLKDAEVQKWVAPPVEDMKQGSVHRVIVTEEIIATKPDRSKQDLQEFAQRFLPQDQDAVRRLCEDAFASGKRFGQNVAIPEDTTVEQRASRMLGHKETA